MSIKIAICSNFRKHLVWLLGTGAVYFAKTAPSRRGSQRGRSDLLTHRYLHVGIAVVAAAAFAASLNAQEATNLGPKNVSGEGPAGGQRMFFLSSDANVDGKVVTGAPFSATETTTLTQTLANGTHIVQKQEASTARDSAGRTRREQNLSSIGPWSTADNKSLVFINDPVAKAHYALEPDGQTAVKSTLGTSPGNLAFVTSDGGFGGPGGQPVTIARSALSVNADIVAGARVTADAPLVPPPPPPGAEVTAFPPMDSAAPGAGVMIFSHREGVGGDNAPPLGLHQPSADFASVETLPSQVIEGVKAEGKRTTTRIPAGTIGNDQDIFITSEVWFSPELQTVVLVKRNDPRVGESVMSLSNIQRNEPDPSLFQVPAGYTVKDADGMFKAKGLLDQRTSTVAQ
jgi:hypothetical protein